MALMETLSSMLSGIIAGFRNMLAGFNQAFADLIVAGVSILIAYIIYRFFKTKATRTKVIVTLSILVYLVMILA